MYTDPQFVWKWKCFFVTITMVVNSLEPNIFSVILSFVWFPTLFDEDVASFGFFLFVVVLVVAFIVVGNWYSGTDRYAVIPWGDLVCLSWGRSGQGWSVLGGVSWFQCKRQRRGGTVSLGQLGCKRRRLSSTLHPPLIGNVKPKLKQ